MRNLGRAVHNDMITLFTPTPDVGILLNVLLDAYERRGGDPLPQVEDKPRRAIRVKMDDVVDSLPGYRSQTDPDPRITANAQLVQLERQGLVHLTWQRGQTNHLLEAVTLEIGRVEGTYTLLGREPLADRRRHLHDTLLGDRFRLDGWRRRAVQHCLDQLKQHKSPAPFNLTDGDWNRDLLAALIALPDEDAREEIPYRVFSVRVFNDSKRFDLLKGAVARLARRHQGEWRALSDQETLRELGLVPNPDHIYLYGPWRLVDPQGQVMSLAEFYPSVGMPSILAARVQKVSVDATHVVCVENLTPFYELVRYENQRLAALCLWGNPSPASRHLLRCLVQALPTDASLLLWADIDYGGLNILAQLREKVSPRFAPYRMDCDTLDAHLHWARPLSSADERNLARLKRRPTLSDMTPLIDHMLQKGIKLEQEAVTLDPDFVLMRDA